MLRRLVHLVSMVALALALGACHDVKTLLPPNLRAPSANGDALAQARQQLQQATPCCGSFADFSYHRMLPWRPKKFELGPGSTVASLNGVRSYFLAFRLPVDVKVPYEVAVKSELTGRWLHNSYLFAPTTVLLDAAFQPIETHDVQLCEYMGWTSATTGAFGSTKVTSDKARYLVVYSSADQQGGSTYWEQSPASFSADAPVRMTSTGSFRIPHGPDGTVWVGLMSQDYRKAVDGALCDKAAPGAGLFETLRTALPTHWSGQGS